MNKTRISRLSRFLVRRERVASYEEHATPQTRDFWSNIRRNPEHPFAKHPLYALHGEDLSKASYDFTERKLQSQGTQPGIRATHGVLSLVYNILDEEREHKSELEATAVRIVSEIYGIPEDRLEGKLMELGEVGGMLPQQKQQPSNERINNPEIRDQINKRMTSNTLTHGAAVHGFMSAFHLAADMLDKIDPELKEMYGQLAAASHGTYWWMNNMGTTGPRAGEVEVVRDPNGGFKVVAMGTTFVVLIQELIKGVMELISLHGFSGMDEQTYKDVTAVADDPNYEQLHIQVGPEVWRRLIKFIPKGVKLGQFMMKVHKLQPKQLHDFLDDVMDNPEKARATVNRMMIT